MNKFFTIFAAALIAVSALSAPVFAAQSGDHIKQHDSVYWNPNMRDGGSYGTTNSADRRNERPAQDTQAPFLPN